MASTAALQVQVHEAGGLQRQQAGTAFADLLSAMEALPEAFRGGKSCVFITELPVLHLWVKSSPVYRPCSQLTHVTKKIRANGLCRAKDLARTSILWSFRIEKQE